MEEYDNSAISFFTEVQLDITSVTRDTSELEIRIKYKEECRAFIEKAMTIKKTVST